MSNLNNKKNRKTTIAMIVILAMSLFYAISNQISGAGILAIVFGLCFFGYEFYLDDADSGSGGGDGTDANLLIKSLNLVSKYWYSIKPAAELFSIIITILEVIHTKDKTITQHEMDVFKQKASSILDEIDKNINSTNEEKKNDKMGM